MGEGWKMFVVHVRWRRLALLGAAIAAVLALTFLLSGCLHGKAQPAEAVPAATAEERAAYLAGFGWQIAPEPVETLHLQLPEDLSAEWRDYLKQQQSWPSRKAAVDGAHTLSYRSEQAGMAASPPPAQKRSETERCRKTPLISERKQSAGSCCALHRR